MSDHTYDRALVDGVWDIDNPKDVDESGNPVRLVKRIESALPSKAFSLRCDADQCVLSFVDDLTAGEITTLDATVSAHKAASGTPAPKLHFVATSTIAASEAALSGSPVAVGGVVTNPSFFADVASLVGRLVGSYKASGGPLELQLTEDNGQSTEDKFSALVLLPDTGDAWTPFAVMTDISPRAGQCDYCLVANYGAGASSASIRHTSLTMLRTE